MHSAFLLPSERITGNPKESRSARKVGFSASSVEVAANPVNEMVRRLISTLK
jgi:hypothetical protein